MKKKKHTIVNDLFPKAISTKINSAKKGQRNEFKLAVLLSEWVGTEFVRVPRSGGLRWKGSQNVAGDLIVIDQKFKFPFCIETKHYKKICFKQRKNSKIFTFWKQAKEAAEREGKIPLLFLKEDRMKDYVMFTDLKLQINQNTTIYNSNSIIILLGYNFERIGKNYTYKQFKKFYKKNYGEV